MRGRDLIEDPASTTSPPVTTAGGDADANVTTVKGEEEPIDEEPLYVNAKQCVFPEFVSPHWLLACPNSLCMYGVHEL